MEILFGGAGADVVRQAEMGQYAQNEEKQLEQQLDHAPETKWHALFIVSVSDSRYSPIKL